MANFDIPALTRGISGLFTASNERKRFDADRAKQQQLQAVADLLAKKTVEERIKEGKSRRAEREQKAQERAAKRIADAEALAEKQRSRMAFIVSQLTPESMGKIKGGEFDNQSTEDQIKTVEGALRRQRTIANRVPRAPTTPKDLRKDARVGRVQTRFLQLVSQGEKPQEVDMLDPNLSALEESGEVRLGLGGRFFRKPIPPAQIRQQAMLQALEEHRHLFADDEQAELTNIFAEIAQSSEAGGGDDETGMSDDKVRQMILDLDAQGLSHEEIQATLAQQGIKVRLR